MNKCMTLSQLGLKDNGTPFRFFIIDDCTYMIQTLTLVIESFGGTVCGHANSEVEAIQWFKHQPDTVDIVTLDINMPQVDGLTLIPHIKQLSPSTRILIISAEATEFNVKKAILLGAEYFISKPFQKPDLFAILKKCCLSIVDIQSTPAPSFFGDLIRRIAVIEHGQSITRFVQDLKKAYPCRIVSCMYDCMNALNTLCTLKHPPTLLLIDMKSCYHSDLDLIQNLVKIYPAMKIAVVSPNKDYALAMKAVNIGAHYLLNKPLTEANLVSAVCQDSELTSVYY